MLSVGRAGVSFRNVTYRYRNIPPGRRTRYASFTSALTLSTTSRSGFCDGQRHPTRQLRYLTRSPTQTHAPLQQASH